MFWSMLLYFALGILLEFLTTLYMRASTSQQPLLASGLSGVVDNLALFVIVGIVKTSSIPLAEAWIFGRMIGSYYGTKIKY
jgi:hypothetical protein